MTYSVNSIKPGFFKAQRKLLQGLAVLVLSSLAASSQAQSQPGLCEPGLSPAIARSCVVKPEVLWRGAKPDSLGAAALLELGVASVVNLELLNDDIPSFLAATPKLNENRTINYFRLREWEPNVVIAPARLEQSIAQFIAILRSQAKPVYVHCRSGQNRTGVMVAAYRIIEQGLPVEQALQEMAGFEGIWYQQNAAFLRKLAHMPRQQLEQKIAFEMRKLESWKKLQCGQQGCQLLSAN